MQLLSDLYSTIEPKKMYGKQGDKVTVVSIHHKVLIVENETGDRFPAPADKLTGFPVDKSATQQVQVSDTIKPSKKTSKTSKTKITQPQNSLF